MRLIKDMDRVFNQLLDAVSWSWRRANWELGEHHS